MYVYIFRGSPNYVQGQMSQTHKLRLESLASVCRLYNFLLFRAMVQEAIVAIPGTPQGNIQHQGSNLRSCIFQHMFQLKFGGVYLWVLY